MAKKSGPVPPGPIPPGDEANFETIKLAHKYGDLALMSAIRKADGQRVSLVCAMERQPHPTLRGETMYFPKPLAVMIEGNPFELFEDPTAV